MGEDGKIFSEGQTDKIYKDMLKPLKVKISEIILYDTEKAMEFLQKYNAILRCKKDNQILSMITDLEFEIYSYEKNIGNQKAFEDKSEVIIQQIEDMKTDGDRLPLEEFEDEFLRLKQTYQTTFQKFSLEERDRIEQQLYELYGRVMVRRVREGAVDELEIPKEDESGLRIFLNNEIGRLSLNANPQVQNVIERIKFKLMDKETAFQGDEIWKLLSFAQNQEKVGLNQQLTEHKKPQVTALAVANQRREGIWSKIKRKFKKEPQLPLQIEDIGKITLDWLAQYIPKSMLEEIENERLAEEGRTPEKKYLPEPRTAICAFLEGKILKKNELDNYDEWTYSYEYIDDFGKRYTIVFEKNLCVKIRLKFDKNIINLRCFDKHLINDSCNTLRYAQFLDNIFGTSFAKDLAIEYGGFIKKYSNAIYCETEKLKNYSELVRTMMDSYENISMQFKVNEEHFRINERDNRRTFYEQTAFKERIKQTEDSQTGTIEHPAKSNDGIYLEQANLDGVDTTNGFEKE